MAAGIGRIDIIDNDVVSLSNLQRQILYNEEHIGLEKTDVTKSVLSKLNSEVKVKTFKDCIDENTITKYLDDQDFIIDCSDNFKTKFLVNKTAVENDMRAVIAGIKDFYGQIITINPKTSACYQCIFPDRSNDSQPDESPLPVVGVTPGILGTLEALEVIKTTLGLPNLENNLLMVNLLNLSFNKIQVVKNEKCICSR